MFPGRAWAALGSGEAMNEHVTGDRWPPKAERDARLLECVAVIRALLAGEEVSHDGLVRVDRARLWTRPAHPPPLVGAAVSEATAARVGSWADGLITVHQPLDKLRRVVDAFRGSGGAGRPVYLQAHLSWAPDEATALRIAHEQWRTNVFGAELAWELELPAQFDAAAAFVRPEDVRRSVLVSADTGWHAARLAELVEVTGADGLFLHHVGGDLDGQRRFIDAFAADVLPALGAAPGQAPPLALAAADGGQA
jgi:G6PDH family F420-dependent oxidoreductase